MQGYFVEAAHYAGSTGKKPVFVLDVDEALLKTMSRVTTEDQRRLIGDWHDLSGKNVFFMTGRAHQSLDEAWGRNLPGSFEHHSMMRIEENGAVLNLAPQIDTGVIGRNARNAIGDNIRVVESPEEVWAARGKEAVVYIEIKNAAVALVHSLGLPEERQQQMRKFLEDSVAKPIINAMGLSKTHKSVVGSDAVEIVPKVHSLCVQAEDLLPVKEQRRIAELGLGKATGIHNLMGIKGEGYIPFMLGDSPNSDGPAMKACEEYGGYGIGVSNGNTLPEEFLRVTRGLIIPTYQATWGHVEGIVSSLKSQPSTVVVIQAGAAARALR